MNFLNSTILAGLAAALVPLLIHLLNRRRVKTVEFSSVMFLRDLRRTRMRRLELRRWLILAVRTLMVVAAVLAFARPALRGRGPGGIGARARTSAVIALDRSASMALETANGTAYERAQTRLREIGALFGQGDDAVGLPFSATVSPAQAPTTDIAGLMKRLSALPVGSGGTDVNAAVQEGLRALHTAGNLNREIYLVTDRRRDGFLRTALAAPSDDTRDRPTIYLIDVTEPGGIDVGVTDLKLSEQLFIPNLPIDIIATLTNFSDRPIDRLLVSLFVDGRRVMQRETSVGEAAAVTVPLTATIATPGAHAGFVEISADDNPLNDRRYFAVTIPDRLRVLLASDYPSGRTSASLALAPPGETTPRIVVDAVDTDQLIRQNLFDYDAVVITEWRRPERLAVDQLVRYARAGGGVFAAPAIDADTAAWNDLIAGPLFTVRMGQPPAPPTSERYFAWERIDWNHPIWSVYRDVPRDRIPEVRWYAAFRPVGRPAATALADFSGGTPALSELRLESGRWLVCWAPLNSPYSDLPLRSLFVPFMNRLVEYLAADLSERRGDFLVGEEAHRELVIPPSGEAAIEVIRPDGATVRPGVEQLGSRRRITCEDTDLPGVYTIRAGEQVVDAFAVNVDPVEMAGPSIAPDELARRWAGYSLLMVAPGESLADTVTRTRYGTEIGPLFLWVVVALFFLEMFLARTKRRDLAPQETVSSSPA